MVASDITSDYIVSLHTMLENLTAKVDQIGSVLEGVTMSASVQIPSAPDGLEVSLSFLAAAMGMSKSTIERRISDKKLPKPRVNPHNNYRYWLKSDLPKEFHGRIDARYLESTKPSR